MSRWKKQQGRPNGSPDTKKILNFSEYKTQLDLETKINDPPNRGYFEPKISTPLLELA